MYFGTKLLYKIITRGHNNHTLSRGVCIVAYLIGMLTASFSFLANRALLKYIGPEVIITYSPMLEEASKTLLSFFLAADIIAAHLTFGLLEAIYDWHNSPQNRFLAAAASLLGHGAFGMVTIVLLFLSGSIWVGLAGGTIAHLFWNRTVISCSENRSGRKK